jgi:hypothetical protein
MGLLFSVLPQPLPWACTPLIDHESYDFSEIDDIYR